MADWPGVGGFDRIGRALNVGDSFNKGALGGHSGSANVKGAWSTVISSLGFDASGFTVFFQNSTGSPWTGLVDIGIGAAGSEVVLVPDLLVRPLINDCLTEIFYCPLAIPTGVRVAARYQNSLTSGALSGEIVPFGGGFTNPRPFNTCLAYGVNTSNSQGTLVTADYPGAWVAIADNVPSLDAIMVACYLEATQSNVFPANYEIGMSAAGGGAVEYLLLPSIPVMARPSQIASRFSFGAFPVRVPPSSKLWARANGVGYASQSLRMAVYGFR